MKRPRKVESTAPVLVLRASVQPLQRAIGLVFALMIVALSAFVLEPGASLWANAVPLVFLVFGLAITFGRSGATVDKARMTLTTWWGFWFPIARTQHAIDAVTHVSIGKEVRGGKKTKTTVFPVRLEPQGLELFAPNTYGEARRTAESAANHFGTSLHDVTTGTALIREAARLDEPLRDRLRRLGTPVEPPHGPAPDRLRVQSRGEETVCVVPTAGVGTTHVFVLTIVVVFAGFFAKYAHSARAPWFILAAFGAIAGVVMFSALAAVVGDAFGSDTLTFSRRGVAHKRWGLLRRATRIPADELEELFVVERRGLTDLSGLGGNSVWARSDETTLCVAANLRLEEAEWLYAAISHALCSTSGGSVGRAP